MTRCRHAAKGCARDSGSQLSPALHGNPGVFLAPEDSDRTANLTVPRLDLISVPLIHLDDLPVEGRLPGCAEPRIDIQLQHIPRQGTKRCARDVGGQDGSMNIGWQSSECGLVVADMVQGR